MNSIDLLHDYNVLFLAAGYGTRIAREIRADTSGSYSHLLHLPKALLPVGGLPLLDHWLRLLKDYNEANQLKKQLDQAEQTKPQEQFSNIFVVTNDMFLPQFLVWAAAAGVPYANIISDHTSSNDLRLGSVQDLNLAIDHFHLQSRPLLVLAGDTLPLTDFSLVDFIAQALSLLPSSLVTSYTVAHDNDTLKTGILEVETASHCSHSSPGVVLERPSESSIARSTAITASLSTHGASTDPPLRVCSFLEKPHPSATLSRLACPCLYFLSPQALNLLPVFLAESKVRFEAGKYDKGSLLDHIDASGKFIAWLIHRHPTYAYRISGRLDIGGLSSYIQADAYVCNNNGLS
ncbi:hypothetical protein BASA50_007185 [Batrachochytrium salamandrivorans]|uniref:MobA-like NTP transferase domain-containing protein n=1 Tax=Batrachochytrium salamandrivorans TaxID=1357716 RepID=A0ABQ8F844_9FUNG|nr:hypothetical protein BASA50_007185 [Batrachochytrium salamandrivorans]KAH9274248.1 hypothetical protein BASA83_003241 [Batrachochytrium salamandrivorans]KAJ1328531.1 hypothetical protein BSLG_010263 [Batrachochytrium salamandrivorans]